jgi:hypothetical protein
MALPFSRRFRLPPYTFHIFSSIALTSFAFHHLHLRRHIEEDRMQLNAKTGILEDLVQRIRNGEKLRVTEVDRLLKLANGGEVEAASTEPLVPPTDSLSWKEAVLGRKDGKETDSGFASRSPDEELNAIQKEWDAGKSSFALVFLTSFSAFT